VRFPSVCAAIVQEHAFSEKYKPLAAKILLHQGVHIKKGLGMYGSRKHRTVLERTVPTDTTDQAAIQTTAAQIEVKFVLSLETGFVSAL